MREVTGSLAAILPPIETWAAAISRLGSAGSEATPEMLGRAMHGWFMSLLPVERELFARQVRHIAMWSAPHLAGLARLNDIDTIADVAGWDDGTLAAVMQGAALRLAAAAEHPAETINRIADFVEAELRCAEAPGFG